MNNIGFVIESAILNDFFRLMRTVIIELWSKIGFQINVDCFSNSNKKKKTVWNEFCRKLGERNINSFIESRTKIFYISLDICKWFILSMEKTANDIAWAVYISYIGNPIICNTILNRVKKGNYFCKRNDECGENETKKTITEQTFDNFCVYVCVRVFFFQSY